jgi:hypothetical protein
MGYREIGKIYFCSLLLKAKINGDWGERVRREMVKALTRMGQTRKIVKIDFIEYLKSMIIYIHLFHPMAKIKNEIVKIVVHHEPYAFPVHGSIVLFMILEVV